MLILKAYWHHVLIVVGKSFGRWWVCLITCFNPKHMILDMNIQFITFFQCFLLTHPAIPMTSCFQESKKENVSRSCGRAICDQISLRPVLAWEDRGCAGWEGGWRLWPSYKWTQSGKNAFSGTLLFPVAAESSSNVVPFCLHVSSIQIKYCWMSCFFKQCCLAEPKKLITLAEKSPHFTLYN